MNTETNINNLRILLQFVLSKNNIKNVNHAIGLYIDLILQDEDLREFLHSDEKDLSTYGITELYNWILIFLEDDVNYFYKPPNLFSALRVYLCYFNRDWYGLYYFGSDYADCQSRWRKNWNEPRHFQASPRDHGKSHIFSFELPLYKICYIDNIRILMSSKSNDLAEKYLGAIKRTIEVNEKIKEDFGNLIENVNPVDGAILDNGKGKGGWSKNILFCRRTNHALKDGTIESISLNSAITGSRFDLIILDDPIEESDCKTVKGRKKQQLALHVLEELLEPDGQFLVIGTRKHYGDLYQYIIDNPRWAYTIDKGIIKFPDHYDFVYKEDPITFKKIIVDVIIPEDETFEVLWKEKWNIKKLLIKKAGTLADHFLRETQNQINSDETSDFPKDVIENNRDIVQVKQRMPFYSDRPSWAKWVVIGVDLSGIFNKQKAEENDNDYTVLTVIAIDHKYNKHIIYAYRERGIDPDSQLNKMVELNYDYKPDYIVLETNAYQKAMESMALREKIPVVPHSTGSEKHSLENGLPGMAVEFINRYFILYTAIGEAKTYYDYLFAELHGYGVEPHDDTVMSLWLANLGANKLIQRDHIKKKNEAKRRGIKVKEEMKTIEENSNPRNMIVDHKTPSQDMLNARAILEKHLSEYQ